MIKSSREILKKHESYLKISSPKNPSDNQLNKNSKLSNKNQKQ